MKALFILPLFMALCAAAQAQSAGDVIRLKDGSVIRGTVVEYLKGDHIRIRTEEGKYLEFPASEVEKTRIDDKAAIPVRPLAFFNNTSVVLMFGDPGGYVDVSPGVTSITGVRFLGRFLTGIGVGLEVAEGRAWLPLFADARYLLRKDNDVSPWVGISAGYGFALTRPYSRIWTDHASRMSGGIITGAELGLRTYTKPNFGFTVSLGYRFQQVTSDYLDYFWNGQETIAVPVQERRQMHRFVGRVGILFN